MALQGLDQASEWNHRTREQSSKWNDSDSDEEEPGLEHHRDNPPLLGETARPWTRNQNLV